MSAAPRAVEGFRLRRLDKPEEFRQAEEVHRLAYGLNADAAVASALLRSLQDNGGLVLGAFADIYLAGFCVAFLGWDRQRLYEYLHLLAVRPEYQNHGVGLRLMRYLKDETVLLGLDELRWTFDPLQSKAAMLYVRRLGARPDRYLVHYYGRMSDAVNRDLESDRVEAIWPIRDERIDARLETGPPSVEELGRAWAEAEAIVTTELAESGVRVPTEVSEPGRPLAHLEVPFDLDLVRRHEPGSLRRWRHAVRDAFRAAVDRGYRVDDFAVLSVGHERRSFYFLRPAGPSPSKEEVRSGSAGTNGSRKAA